MHSSGNLWLLLWEKNQTTMSTRSTSSCIFKIHKYFSVETFSFPNLIALIFIVSELQKTGNKCSFTFRQGADFQLYSPNVTSLRKGPCPPGFAGRQCALPGVPLGEHDLLNLCSSLHAYPSAQQGKQTN